MKIKKPALVINMKNFPHIYSDKSIELAVEKASLSVTKKGTQSSYLN